MVMLVTAIALAILGLCLGSFVNALVWRIHVNKNWVKARSQCPTCGHILSARDLIPVISWLSLRGRCRYCGNKISWQYPISELGLSAVFMTSYYFWPGGLTSTGPKILFISWLISAVGLLALFIYDLRWMLLPSKILAATALVAITGRLIYLIGFEPSKTEGLANWLLSITVASGLFGLFYIISRGRWIGDGDISLGLITGTLLADPLRSFLMIFLASLIGTLVVLPAIISGRRALGTRVAYGPFLILAAFIVLLFGDPFIDWYKALILV
ncbi:MAG: prepilin peptidase [Candidatus Saccharimonadales bacterium]